MKLVINGKEYDIEAGLRKATLNDLYVLKVRDGVGMKTLMQQAQIIEKYADPADMLEDPDSFKVFMAIIWLARRHAGEKLTFEEATSDFGLEDLRIVVEDGDDPKVQAPSPDGAEAESQPQTLAVT